MNLKNNSNMKIELLTRINSITRKQDRIQLQMDLVSKAINCRGENFYRLFCKELYDPKVSNSQVQNSLSNLLTESLQTHNNIFMFTYGSSGTGKTHTLFGSDVFQNDLQKVIFKLKKIPQLLQNMFQILIKTQQELKISLSEIRYEQNREELFDLLSQKVKDSLPEILFKSIQNEQELESIFYEGINRSVNFEQKNNTIKFKNNESNFILQLQILNQNKIQYITLVDLIGFTSNQTSTQQVSLNNLNFDYFSKSPLGKLFDLLMHTSKTFCFFTPTESKQQEHLIEKVHDLIQKDFELSVYPQIKQSETLIQRIKQASLNQPEKMTNFKPNLQIKPEKIIIEKPSLRIQMEDKKIKNKIEKIVDKKIENKISERQFQDLSNDQSISSGSVAEFWKKQLKVEEEEEPSQMQIEQEKQTDFENHLKDIRAQMSELNQQIGNSDYEENQANFNERNCNNYTLKKQFNDQQKNVQESWLETSEDIAILKKNYVLLMELYNKSEREKKSILTENELLKNDLTQIQAQQEIQLQNEKMKYLEVQKKMRLVAQENNQGEIQEYYEALLQKLYKDKNALITENNKILNEISKSFEADEDRETYFFKNRSLRSHIIKRNDQLTKQLKKSEEEIEILQKQISKQDKNQGIQDSMNHRIGTLQKQLQQKIHIEKQLTQENQELQQTVSNYKNQLHKLQQNYDSITQEYKKIQEKLALFQEMADENVQIQREQRIKDEAERLKDQRDLRKRKQNIFQQLKSLMD